MRSLSLTLSWVIVPCLQCLFSRLRKYLLCLSPSLYHWDLDLKIAPFVRNKYNCKNIVTEQTYPGLCDPWIIFTRQWTKIAVLFASFWGKWFPGARFACWAVTFSHENIFGFDIPADVHKRYCEQETLLNSKTKTNFPSFFTLKLTHQYRESW